MAWFTYEVRSWAEFVGIADAHILLGPPLLNYFDFRGQPVAEWTLQPSLARATDEPLGELLAIEKCSVGEFRTQCDSHFPAHLLASDDLITWWAAMQHYRAPTRLLDWTRSPYVALYFAVADQTHWNQDGAVFSYHPFSLVDAMSQLYPDHVHLGPPGEDIITLQPEWLTSADSPPCLYSTRSRFNTDRMLAQMGCFTVCLRPDMDHADVIDKALYQQGVRSYHKLVIPASLKPQFLHRLRAMNIAANALFPGLDGVGRSVSELVAVSRCKETYVSPTPEDFRRAGLADYSARSETEQWLKSPAPRLPKYTPGRGRVLDGMYEQNTQIG